MQDYLIAHGQLAEADAGRMIALMGDAELDEGNIYEALIEGYKHDVRNCWWIVDYNRQSLDATTADRMFDRFDDIFRTCGWRVLTLKHGKLQKAAFAEPGGAALEPGSTPAPTPISPRSPIRAARRGASGCSPISAASRRPRLLASATTTRSRG